MNFFCSGSDCPIEPSEIFRAIESTALKIWDDRLNFSLSGKVNANSFTSSPKSMALCQINNFSNLKLIFYSLQGVFTSVFGLQSSVLQLPSSDFRLPSSDFTLVLSFIVEIIHQKAFGFIYQFAEKLSSFFLSFELFFNPHA